jgi:hypothetical protein
MGASVAARIHLVIADSIIEEQSRFDRLREGIDTARRT